MKEVVGVGGDWDVKGRAATRKERGLCLVGRVEIICGAGKRWGWGSAMQPVVMVKDTA